MKSNGHTFCPRRPAPSFQEDYGLGVDRLDIPGHMRHPGQNLSLFLYGRHHLV